MLARDTRVLGSFVERMGHSGQARGEIEQRSTPDPKVSNTPTEEALPKKLELADTPVLLLLNKPCREKGFRSVRPSIVLPHVYWQTSAKIFSQATRPSSPSSGRLPLLDSLQRPTQRLRMEFPAAGFSGAAAPVTVPLVRCADEWWTLRKNTKRPVPGIVCPKGRFHNVPYYREFLPLSKMVLRAQPWVRGELSEPEVRLEFVTAALLQHHLWKESETSWFRFRTIRVLGTRKTHERLAIIISAVTTGVLRRECCELGTSRDSGFQSLADEASDQASFVTCESELFDAEGTDGEVGLRIQAQQDWWGFQMDWSLPRAAFARNEPQDGLPVSMPLRVVVPIVLGIHTRPYFAICIPSRVLRDLGRLMHDPRGHFEIHAEYTARSFASRGEVGSLTTFETYMWEGLEGFDLLSRLCFHLRDLVVNRICFDSDDGYHRPAREAYMHHWQLLEDWSGYRQFHEGMSEYSWLTRSRYRAEPPFRPVARIFFDRNQQLTPKCQEFLEFYRSIGIPFEPADLHVGPEAEEEATGLTGGRGIKAKAKALLPKVLPPKASDWLARHRRPPAVPIFWYQRRSGDWNIYTGEATKAGMEQCYKTLPKSMKRSGNVWFFSWHNPRRESDNGRRYIDFPYPSEEEALDYFVRDFSDRHRIPLYIA